MADAEGLDFKDVAAIVKGALNFGRLRFHPKALMFKSQKSGKIDQFSSTDICEIQWMRASRGFQLLILTNSSAISKFVGLEEKSKDVIKKFINENYEAVFIEKEPFIKGWNWGSVDFNGPLMVFHNDDKPMFEVPLSDVSTATVNKNEVTVEFHQDDDNDLSLVEMRFYVPNPGTGIDEEVPADRMHKSVMKFADVIKATGDVIVKFEQVLLQTPRGRYDVDMYPSFLRLHGKSYDYKIPYTTMIRLFLLPHNDQRSVYFVITTDPPIRQGQTRYPHIVIQFIKDDWSDLILEMDEETLTTKYEGKLQKEMAGPTYETFSKVMKFVVGQKIFVPGNFVSSSGSQAVACSHKANSGFIYPLEKGFMYVVKPPVHIRFDEVASVNFSRVASGVGQSRSFDLEIETKSGANYIFASIEKKEYSKLFDFVKSKKLRIQNTKGGDDAFQDDFGGGGSGSDNEMPDHYLEKMKKEGEARSDSDSDESPDEDFVAGETPDTSPSSSSETEAGEAGDDGKKKKRKVEKETEINGKKGSPKPRKERKERKEKGEKKTKAQKKAERDPNKPKKPPTAYFLWLAENRNAIKEENPGIKITEIAKKAGELWRALETSDKQVFDEQAKVLKVKYDASIVEYNKDLALNPRTVPESEPKSEKTTKKKKPTPQGSNSNYKSKETIDTDDDISTDSDEEAPLKPKNQSKETPEKDEPESPKKEEPLSDSSPEKEKPKKVKPEKEKSRKETPEKKKPEKEKPKKVKPEKETPEKETPEKETPEKETPEKETPEKETPEKETPEKKKPDKEISGDSKKRKREENASGSKKDDSREDDSDTDSDVPAPESDSSAEKSPPPKRSMRSKGNIIKNAGDLKDDTFGEEELTDGERPPSPGSSESE